MIKIRRLFAYIKNNLRLKIAILFIFLVLIPVMFLGIINARLISRETENILISNTKEITMKQLERLDDLYNRTNELAVQFMLNAEFKNRLKNYDGTLDLQGVENYNYIRNELNNVMIQRSEYSNLAILPIKCRNFTDKNLQPFITVNYLGDPAEIIRTPWYQKAVYTFDIPCLIKRTSADETDQTAGADLVFISAVKNLEIDKKLGTVCIFIPSYKIDSIFSSFDTSMQYEQIVTDSDGNIILDNTSSTDISDFLQKRNILEQGMQQESISTFWKELSNRKYLIISAQSFTTGFKVQYAIPQNKIFHNIRYIKNINLGVSILCLLFSCLVIYIIFRQILLPLKELRCKMTQVENGSLDVSANVSGDMEIQSLMENFNNMVRGITEKSQKLLEAEKKKREYEIMALQSQINPHFLYNTLDSIKWIALTQGNKTIEKMSQYLIFLLRKTISDSREFIPLKDQLESVDCYIELQKLRYYNSFDYQVLLPPELEQVMTPKLLIQPLVENALFHGIYNCGRRGLIRVEVCREKESVIITVYDNGRGIDSDFTSTDILPQKESFSGIGVNNVDERLKLYYGEPYGLLFQSEKDVYTMAIITIPYK